MLRTQSSLPVPSSTWAACDAMSIPYVAMRWAKILARNGTRCSPSTSKGELAGFLAALDLTESVSARQVEEAVNGAISSTREGTVKRRAVQDRDLDWLQASPPKEAYEEGALNKDGEKPSLVKPLHGALNAGKLLCLFLDRLPVELPGGHKSSSTSIQAARAEDAMPGIAARSVAMNERLTYLATLLGVPYQEAPWIALRMRMLAQGHGKDEKLDRAAVGNWKLAKPASYTLPGKEQWQVMLAVFCSRLPGPDENGTPTLIEDAMLFASHARLAQEQLGASVGPPGPRFRPANDWKPEGVIPEDIKAMEHVPGNPNIPGGRSLDADVDAVGETALREPQCPIRADAIAHGLEQSRPGLPRKATAEAATEEVRGKG